MIHPTIHLNGTHRIDLIDNWNDAYNALATAIRALQACAPHARDYAGFHVGPDAFQTAVREHRIRIEKLERVMLDLDELRERACDAQAQ